MLMYFMYNAHFASFFLVSSSLAKFFNGLRPIAGHALSAQSAGGGDGVFRQGFFFYCSIKMNP